MKMKRMVIKLNHEEAEKLIKAGMVHKGMMMNEDIDSCEISVYRDKSHEMGIKIELDTKE